MKELRSVFSLVILLVALSFSQYAMAQPRGDKGGRGHGKMEHLAKELNLTDAQKEKASAIQEKFRSSMMQLRQQKDTGDRTAKKAAFKTAREQMDADFKAILTAEQLTKYGELQSERKTMREGKKAEHKALKEQFKNVDKKAMKTEMKAYHKENVTPVMLTQRAKLEQKLSASEKQKITSTRSAMKALKPQMKAAKEAMHTARKADTKPSESDVKKMKGLREQHRKLMAELKPIAENHKEDVKALFKEIEPQSKEWKEEQMAIAKKHGMPVEKMKEMHKGKKDGHGKHGKKALGKKGKGHHGKHKGHKGVHGKKGKGHGGKTIGFLLLDPKGSDFDLEETETFDTPVRTVNVYPNPAMTYNTIEFDVKSSGNVIIELLNKEGKLERLILSEYREAGEHSLKVDLNGLDGIIYFYRITDGAGSATQKFMMNKN